MQMVKCTVAGVNKNGTVNMSCANGGHYKNVYLLGQNTGNTIGMINMPVIDMPLIAFIDKATIYAMPISRNSAEGDMPGDIGMYDTATHSSIKMVKNKGAEIKVGSYLHLFFGAVKGIILGLFNRVDLASKRYKFRLIDDDESKCGIIEVFDKDYNKTLAITFGDDAEQDSDAILSVHQHIDGTVTIKQNDNTNIEYNEDGSITFACKHYELSTEHSNVDIQDDIIINTDNKTNINADEVNIEAGTKFSAKGSDGLMEMTTSNVKIESNGTIKLNGQILMQIDVSGNTVKVNPAMVELAGGSQFIALAIPLIQLFLSHTHIDPLSGTTGTAIPMGDPSSILAKKVTAQ